MKDLDDFILVNDYKKEAGLKDTLVITPKNPSEVAIIPSDYRVMSISFKNKNILVQRVSMTTIEELKLLFPEPNE
jgi:hypothetical protein